MASGQEVILLLLVCSAILLDVQSVLCVCVCFPPDFEHNVMVRKLYQWLVIAAAVGDKEFNGKTQMLLTLFYAYFASADKKINLSANS